MEKEVIVLGMSRYNFLNQETGEMISGTKVHYVEVDFQNEKDSVGVIPQTAVLSFEEFEKFDVSKIPGVYKADLHISLRGKRPVLKIMGFNYAAPFNLRNNSATAQNK